MAGFDGRGPEGMGPLTGRGMGVCDESIAFVPKSTVELVDDGVSWSNQPPYAVEITTAWFHPPVDNETFSLLEQPIEQPSQLVEKQVEVKAMPARPLYGFGRPRWGLGFGGRGRGYGWWY